MLSVSLVDTSKNPEQSRTGKNALPCTKINLNPIVLALDLSEPIKIGLTH